MPSVFVTSGNRGIGLEFVRQYAADGWTVHAACRDPDRAEELQRLSRNAKGSVSIVAMDVTDQESIAAAATRLGDAPVDLLINSAGVLGQRSQRLGNLDYAEWMHVLDVNVLGAVRVTERLLENVARSARKLVVNITSGMGSIADNTSGGMIEYRTSKTALNMAARTIAIDLKPRDVVCIVVNPGWVKTDMGGPNATLTAEASVAGMRRLFDSLGPADSGKFFNHDGREYPW
jgi:NAD(P)-dependent dehydrogenase (short-subunit alcohol dehydrogenase family)